MNLFGQEFKITLKSLTYWVVVLFIGIFLFTQIGTDMEIIREPKPNQESYDITITHDKKEIQQQRITSLFNDYSENMFRTYPFGFYKSVHPTDNELKKIVHVLENATGMSIEKLQTYWDDYDKKLKAYEEKTKKDPNAAGYKEFSVPMAKEYSYNQFEKDMQDVADILGKGSDYEKEFYTTSTYVSMTYKQAKAEYQDIVKKDHVIGAYARMVCDYLGIVLSLIPAFIGSTVMLRDRRSKSEDVIFTKSVSSAKVVGLRYLSTVLLVFIPVLIFSLNPALQASTVADKLNVDSNLLLFFKYIIGWTLPTILAVVGISFLLTECFGGIIAVIAQFALCFLQLMSGSMQLTGKVGWNLIPRFNSVGFYSVFENIFHQLVVNRIFWSMIGLICLVLTIVVYNYKRKGGLTFGKKHQVE